MDQEAKEETTVFINEENINGGETTDPDRSTPTRAKWDRKLDFILSLVGYSVGVSNLWRFPYLCLRNGGGAFLIPFFFFLLVTGIPLFYMEICLGQFSATSPLFVWKLCPLFKGIGWGACIVSGITSIYYVAVIAWNMFYLINAFYPTLPWSTCDNWWNTGSCIGPLHGNATTLNTSMAVDLCNTTLSSLLEVTNVSSALSWNTSMINASVAGEEAKTATEEFWQYYVLRKSDGVEEMGSLQPHLVGCLFVSWLLVFLCLIKGVKSLGKVVYVTALFPYLLLTILLIRGLLLPGAVDGIKFYVYPEFSRLATFSVWIEAAIQVFFSLGPAWGSIMTMSSFNDFNNNCFRDTIIVSLADGLTSFYSGFVVFSVVGFMAKEANVSVTDIATQGPGLALVAYPEAIGKLPLPQLWAVFFFLMLIMLGLDTQFGMVENLVAGITDAFPRRLSKYRTLVTAGVSMTFFLLGLPITMNGGIYIFQLMDWFTTAFCLFVCSFLECIVIGWIYGVDRFSRDIELMLGRRPGILMKFCWCISTPLIMLTIFIVTLSAYQMPTYDGYTYPVIARAIGFVFAMLPIIPLPFFMVLELSKAKGTLWERFLFTLRPASDWKPSKKKYQHGYKTEGHEFVLPLKSLLPRRTHVRQK
ncbi:sodium- and chloride-dependent glycine transporter 1-like isoform X1 [Haliotis rufescens]|uniref:sodium- and chloride-dependent glycine transporter 1-like isoform X1 n=2 Tax=Haliotis rufescens TaxID=6454 RepID=UPI00201F6ACE|nr:sodium- and chloride-dependent glycine transporter 1-like isoform X1 [Haliotis rufescens]